MKKQDEKKRYNAIQKLCIAATCASLITLSFALPTTLFPKQKAWAEEPNYFAPQTGYRIKRYRAPVPETVPGAKRILSDDVEAHVLNKTAILIDVMPAIGGGPHPKTGKWRLSKPRQNIPGSAWLPDVGLGKLDPKMQNYFTQNLVKLTSADKTKTIIIYCQADCWMSWNAVQRAVALGYSNVLWYAEGSDGWSDWNGKLEPATPIPLNVP